MRKRKSVICWLLGMTLVVSMFLTEVTWLRANAANNGFTDFTGELSTGIAVRDLERIKRSNISNKGAAESCDAASYFRGSKEYGEPVVQSNLAYLKQDNTTNHAVSLILADDGYFYVMVTNSDDSILGHKIKFRYTGKVPGLREGEGTEFLKNLTLQDRGSVINEVIYPGKLWQLNLVSDEAWSYGNWSLSNKNTPVAKSNSASGIFEGIERIFQQAAGNEEGLRENLYHLEGYFRIVFDSYVSTVPSALAASEIKILEGSKNGASLSLKKDSSGSLVESIVLSSSSGDNSILLEIPVRSSDPQEYASVSSYESDALGLTQILSATDAELKDFGAVKSFRDAVRVVFDELQTELDEQTEQTVQGDVDGDVKGIVEKADKAFSKVTAYEKWWLLMQEYYKSGATGLTVELLKGYGFTGTSGCEGFRLSNFETWFQSHHGTQNGKTDLLSYQEYTRLHAYMRLSDIKAENPISPPSQSGVSDSTKVIDMGTAGPRSPQSIKSDAEEIIRQYDESIATIEANQRNILLNASGLVKYLAAVASGYRVANPFESDTETDVGVLSRCDFLEELRPDIKTDVATTGESYVPPARVPEIRSIGTMGTTREAHGAYYQLQYVIALAYSYAASPLSGLEEVTADEGSSYLSNTAFYNPSLETAVSAALGSNDLSDLQPRSEQTRVKIYKQIYEALKYLGINPEDVSERVAVICEYYNILASYDTSLSVGVYVANDEEPLRQLFNVSTKTLSNYYRMGVAMSATYIPLQTNVYDISSVATVSDTSFIERFHYPYGFYRKALYIDEDLDAAVNRYVTDSIGSTRVARLSDLLEPEKDIVLYLDDNFYNVKELAKLQGYSYSESLNGYRTASGSAVDTTSAWYNLTDWWSSLFEVSLESVIKTNEELTYSTKVAGKIQPYGSTEPDEADVVLSSEYIDKYLTVYDDSDPTQSTFKKEIYDEYTPLQSFALTSAIYRDSTLFNGLNSYAAEKEPVFVSSPDLAAITEIPRKEFNSIYNYLMLKNLKGNLGIDYKSTIDVDSVLYLDIYGNILTESGLVVIPAASNATLTKPNYYYPYTAGFVDLYTNGYHLPADYNNSAEYLGDNSDVKEMFRNDTEKDTWELTNREIYGYAMNFSNLALSNTKVLESLQTLASVNISKDALDFWQRAYIITEVLRGAPVENINKETEGLGNNSQVTKQGVYFAYKLEELTDGLLSTQNGNSMISLPNLAYVEGIEYVVVFGFKVLFAVCIVMLLYHIYRDAVAGVIGIKSIIRFVSVLLAFAVIIYGVPKALDLSYYQANKLFLQNEVSEIAMLNLEKRYEGKEVGVVAVTEPSTETKLYLKLDTMEIPWYEALDDVLTSDALATMDEVYEKAFESNPISEAPGVIKKSNGLYLNLDDVFDATQLTYVPESNGLTVVYKETPVASFFLPYYAVLDELVARINSYNSTNNIMSYTTKVQSGGRVKTLGLIKPFLESDYFMKQSLDVLGFYDMYGIDTTLQEVSAFSTTDREDMSNSLWYMDGSYEEEILRENIESLNAKAREYISQHRNLLGKISDETFLKVMALNLAIEYNNIFRVSACRSIEIYDIDAEDILRFAVADSKTVLEQSSKSFARFVYSNSSTFGIFLTTVLVLLYAVAGLAKTLCILSVVAVSVWALIINKLFKRKDSGSLEGFLITMLLICGVNLLYAVMLKLSMKLPDFGWTAELCILVQIILQILYFAVLLKLTVFVVARRDDMGFAGYQQTIHDMVYRGKESVYVSGNQVYSGAVSVSAAEALQTENSSGKEILDMMHRRDEEREG